MKRRTASPITRILRWTAGAVLAAAAVVAVMDLTPLVRITDVRIAGANEQLGNIIRDRILTDAEVSYFGHSFGHATMLHTDISAVRDGIIAEYPDVSEVIIRREWPHGVSVTVTERVPVGIWCRGADDRSCRFWDRSGARWGTAVPSIGPLLLLVIDERADDTLPDLLRDGILAAIDGIGELGMSARRIVLPDAEPGGIRLETASATTLAMDALGDVTDQLGTLRVFLADRGTQPLPALIDVRTSGRVYFRAPAPGN